MADSRSTSGLPSTKGSPFVSGNLNKFLFGIILAAIVLGAIDFAAFAGFFRHNAPAHPQSSKSELMREAPPSTMPSSATS